MAVWAGLFLAHDAPAPDTELVELVAAGQAVGVLQHSLLLSRHQQLVAAHRARVRLQPALRDTLLLVVALRTGQVQSGKVDIIYNAPR